MNRAMAMLQRTLACLILCGAVGTAVAQDVVPDLGPEEVIAPEVARREVEVPKIKSNDYELGVYLGMYSVEDFGTNPLAGLYFAYHLPRTYSLAASSATARSRTTLLSFSKAQLASPYRGW